MKKMSQKNNKGFSLVELIVVVAIMAVLIGVLVPTLVKNVEKSKKQKDRNAIEEIRTAPVVHDNVCDKTEMKAVVKRFLGIKA